MCVCINVLSFSGPSVKFTDFADFLLMVLTYLDKNLFSVLRIRNKVMICNYNFIDRT